MDFVDGAQSETTPTIGNITASNLVQYANDAAYEAAESGAPTVGNIYYNTTDNTIRFYNGTIWQEVIDEQTVQAIENKVIDADNNTITNIDNNEIKNNAGIEASKIADGSVSDAEFQHLDGVTSDIQGQLDAKIPNSEKGAVNGVAELDGSGTVPASQLPSYVDDVLEYADLASFPVTGETGKIYIAIDTGFNYRWSGSIYIDITSKVDSVNGDTGVVSLGIVDMNDTDITPAIGEDGKVIKYDHSSGDFILADESGGGTGQGGINYIENSGFEDGTSLGWNLYNDGASSEPVDGTGGSLSALTSSVQNSTALRGTKHFRLEKSAFNGQGDGASYDLAIDTQDANKFLDVSFDYISSTYTSGDLRVFVYDIDNTVLLGEVVNSESGDILSSNTPTRFLSRFYTTDSLNYRLIFHVTSTNATAWNMDIDNIRVGPADTVIATNVQTELVDVSADANFTAGKLLVSRSGGNVTVNVEETITYSSASSVTSASALIPEWARPAGNKPYNISHFTGTLIYEIRVLSDGTFTVNTRNFSGAATATTSFDVGSISYCVDDGLSTNVISNTQLNQKTVSVSGAGNAGTAITANVTDIDFTEVRDSHNAWNGTQFTAPISGRYTFKGTVNLNAPNAGALYGYLNGSQSTLAHFTGASASTKTFVWEGVLNKGQVWSLRSDTGTTLVTSSILHFLEVSSHPDFTSYGVLNPQSELLEDSVGTLTAHPGPQGQWVALAQLDLTDGEWDIEARVELQMAAATSVSEAGISITDNAGTSNPGSHAIDKMFSEITNNSGDLASQYFSRRGVVVSGGPTTWYLRHYLGNSASNINYACIITARRVK